MKDTGLEVIRHLLTEPVEPPERIDHFNEWKKSWHRLVPRWKTTVDRALAAGWAADRPAWAFAAGYQAAIQRLAPRLVTGQLAAIGITEAGGSHPARIQCRLTAPSAAGSAWRLDGTKAFVSGAGGAEMLLVVASTGKTPEGRNALRLVAVPADLAGVTITALPPLGMVPELPHGQIRFTSVALPEAALMPGDGYTDVIKPFRTLEDLHVTGALLAWIFGVGRRAGWPDETLEAFLALLVAVRGLALASPRQPHVHLVLGGLLAQVETLLKTIAPLWAKVDEPIRKWWRRDRRLLDIAGPARQRRLAAARACFCSG